MSKAKSIALSTLIAGCIGTAIYFFPQYAVALGALASLVPSPLATLLAKDEP